MGRVRSRHLQWLLAACLLASGTQAVSMTRECALRDAQVLMRIEAHQSMGATQETFDAMFALMHARHLCHEGKVREAMAVYDAIGSAPASVDGGSRGARTDLR